jgi:hypothetical protein
MIKLLDFANFHESWAEIHPNLAAMDKEVNLNIKIFTDLAFAQAQVIDTDCLPSAVASFMVRVQVAMSYTNVMTARVGVMLNEYSMAYDKGRAQKAAALNNAEEVAKRPKSEAALERMLTIDPDLISLKWSIEDLKIAHEFCKDTFRTLQKGAEAWRARYYGAGADKNLTPGINESDPEERNVSAFPPRIGR